MKICPTCGAAVEDNAAVCMKCGAQMAYAQPQYSAPNQAQFVPPYPGDTQFSNQAQYQNANNTYAANGSQYRNNAYAANNAQYANPGQNPNYSQGAAYGYPQNPYVTPDAPNIGFGVLGFFIPIVGLILFLVWKDQTPLRAKSAGKGALIRVIVNVALSILSTIMYVVLFGMASIEQYM